MKTRVKAYTNHLIVALIVVSVFELAFLQSVRSDTGLYSSVSKFPLPAGYLSTNQFFTPAQAPCVLLRVSSDSCRYCRIDQPYYKELAEQARRAQCVSLILAPKTGQINFKGDDAGTKYLQFIDYRFASVLKPLSTPQTILLNRDGGLAWYREGVMDDRALAMASRALRNLK